MTTKDKVLGALRDRTNEYVSGSQIASHLNISRNAVWKAIEQLRADGYKINAITHKGYRLTALSDKLVPDIIARYLEEEGVPRSEIAPIYFFNEIPSTNKKLKEVIAAGGENGTSVIARILTDMEGQGSDQRDVEADNIFLSVMIHPSTYSSFSSRNFIRHCVITVHTALQELLGISCTVKKYDDLYYKGRLISEMYIEGAGDFKNGVTSYTVFIAGIAVYGKGLPWNRALLTAHILKRLAYTEADLADTEAAYRKLCETIQ